MILSPNFFKKDWPQRELDGLTARERKGVKVILPVWHNVDREYVLRYSPTLADKLAVSTDQGPDKVVDEVLKAISKDTFLKEQYERGEPSQEEIPPPRIHFDITQDLIGGGKRTYPDVGFKVQNLDPLPVRLRIVARTFLDQENLGNPSPESGYYTGKKIWHINPGITVYGHFTSPVPKVETHQRLEIRVVVTVIDQRNREHRLLPVGWVYVPETNSWYFEP